MSGDDNHAQRANELSEEFLQRLAAEINADRLCLGMATCAAVDLLACVLGHHCVHHRAEALADVLTMLPGIVEKRAGEIGPVPCAHGDDDGEVRH